MRKQGQARPRLRGRTLRIAGLLVVAQLCAAVLALAFTQGAGPRGTGGTPQGHEWLTMRSALEVVGDLSGTDPSDPRTKPLPDGKPFPRAGNTQLTPEIIAAFKKDTVNEKRYGARYKPVLDAILGQRWVDIGGFNVAASNTPGNTNCFENIAQLPDDLQRDHFCRMRGDGGGKGAVEAMNDSTARFKRYFVEAAMANADSLRAWDGGGWAEEVRVDRRFFLFGRAIHLFQDSFSEDHAVRFLDDGYKKLHGMKTYLCTLHSDQHSNIRPIAVRFDLDYAKIGDVIWTCRFCEWETKNVKLNALTAVEGMKDTWAAFLRVLALPEAQRRSAAEVEAQKIVDTWLAFDPQKVIDRYDDPDAYRKIPTFVKDQAACDKERDVKMDRIAENRRVCVWNVRPDTGDRDVHLHIPFLWAWKSNTRWCTPPASFDPTREPPLPSDCYKETP